MNKKFINNTNNNTNRHTTNLPNFFYSARIYRHRVAGRIFMEAVLMAAEDLNRLSNIRQAIYEPIAQRHGTTVNSVSKNIRDVRDTIMKYGGADLLEEMTGSKHWHTEAPYPHEVIEVFARYVRTHGISHDIL